MRSLPGCLFVVDLKREENAVREARKLNIPIVAVVDTNCDPDLVDYVIPGNDDAIRAIQLFASIIADAVIEGRQGESFGGMKEERSPQRLPSPSSRRRRSPPRKPSREPSPRKKKRKRNVLRRAPRAHATFKTNGIFRR